MFVRFIIIKKLWGIRYLYYIFLGEYLLMMLKLVYCVFVLLVISKVIFIFFNVRNWLMGFLFLRIGIGGLLIYYFGSILC